MTLLEKLGFALRSSRRRCGDSDAQSRWAGQGAPLVRRGPAAQLVERIAAELAEVRARLCCP